MLTDGPPFSINGSFGSAEKKVSISFNKANTKFFLRLHHNIESSYLSVNGKNL